MTTPLVLLDVRDRVAYVTRNDPARRNALGPDLLAELDTAWSAVERDREVRVVVLRAAGTDFCAGGDISTFDRAVAGGRDYVYDRSAPSVASNTVASRCSPLCGGEHSAAVSSSPWRRTLIIAADTARFALPELSVGAVPAFALVRLGELIGRSRAKHLAWSGRRLEPAEAERIGFVSQVVADDDLDASVEVQARALVALPRVAAETVKAAVNREITDHALFESTTAAAMLWGTEGIADGRRAFYDKRPPNFPDE